MARVPARSGRSNGGGSFMLLGNRVPGVVVVLAVATLLASIVAAVGQRNGFPLLKWAVLVPDAVMRGELWRLFTWVFFEMEPFGVLFGGLLLVSVGADLALRWGPARFIAYYFGIVTLVGLAVCGLSWAIPSLRTQLFVVGLWPPLEALVILWAAYYPTRQIRFMFVLPVAGRQLIIATVGLTVLMSLFYGVVLFIPQFIAEAIAIAIAFAPTPRNLWLEAKLRGMEKQRRASHLKSVPRNLGDDEEPPSGGRWLN